MENVHEDIELDDLVDRRKPILSSLLNHLSQENVTQQCLCLLTYIATKL